MTAPSPLSLPALRARLEAVGETNWRLGGRSIAGVHNERQRVYQAIRFDEDRSHPFQEEAELIVHAPADLRACVEEIERLQTEVHRLATERRETVAMLRLECVSLGASTDWPDDLHLADVVEKHLCRAVWERLEEQT